MNPDDTPSEWEQTMDALQDEMDPENRVGKPLATEGADDTDPMDQYPSETIRAVEPNEVTAGVDVTLYDLDELNFPFMIEVKEYWPPEDEKEAETVAFYGGHASLAVASTILDLVGDRFDAMPWDLEDENA